MYRILAIRNAVAEEIEEETTVCKVVTMQNSIKLRNNLCEQNNCGCVNIYIHISKY